MYVQTADAKEWVGRFDDDDEPLFAAALLAAERAVDRHCGQRFELEASATTRVFRVHCPDHVDIAGQLSVIGDTTGMVVATDDNDDGTAEVTWTSGVDYYTEPLNGLGPDARTGWPVTRLVAAGTRSFPVCGVRPGLHVTARWGWSTPPAPVLLAVRMLAAAWYQRRATVTGAGSYEGWFASAIRDDQAVTDLLAPYRTGAAMGAL